MKFGAFSSLLATLALVCSSIVDAEYTEATSDNFDSLVTNAKDPVVVVFCAIWHGPCRVVPSYVDNSVGNHPPMTMVYVDIDKTPEFIEKYKITSIPTVKGIYKNQVVKTIMGAISQGQADEFIDQFAAKTS